MKFLLLLVVIVFAAWLFNTRRRAGTRKPPPDRPTPKAKGKADAPTAPAAMLACVHCGLHLPQPDVLFDVAGRAYCSEAHRLAGPR